MRKKWLRGSNREQNGESRQQQEAPQRRTARVRNRLAASVALVSVAVLGAGAPAVVLALDDTTDAQRLVDLAETNRGAVALAHSLADERDAMTRYVADGRTTASGGGVSESMRARVDRQVKEVRGEVPATVRRLLDDLPGLRQQALSGHGSALDVFTSYTKAVQALNGIADTLARKLPADADSGATAALAPLGRGAEEASATRGLLLAALAAGGGQSKLVTAAQRTNVREQSALADFRELAPASVRDRYDRTVNGTEVTDAERYIARLTDQDRFAGNDFFLDDGRVESSLNARVDQMRGVESALASSEAAHLAQLRDDDVTALELRIALVGGALLLALGISVHSARSMTRPLAALRLGARRVAADPAAEEPVAFKGREDEFAEAVRSVNELHAAAVRAQERATRLDAERARLVGERQRLADEADGLREERDAVATRLGGLRARVHGSFVSLALRSLGLIERQLAVIESMEETEQDPDRLETLFQLDHLATGMRRYGENLLIIAGSENQATHPGPVSLLDVLRASISEVERYDRVQIQALPPHAQVAGFAADSISHLIAELLDNATSFSPPDAQVQVAGWLLESGEVMLSIQDEGIGMTPERFVELNNRLADPVPEYCQGPQPEDPLGLGLYVVTRLAARHGVRVQLREQKPGGVAATVVLPIKILPAGPPGAGLPPAPPVGVGASLGGARLPAFPGSEAEANSNALAARDRSAASGGTRRDQASAQIPTQTVPEAAAQAVPEAAAGIPVGAAPVAEPEPRAPEPGPFETASEAEASVPWAAPGEGWAQATATDGAYPMEPTPPRGHPRPGSGGELPNLPKHARTSAQAAPAGADGAPAPTAPSAPSAPPAEPDVPAVEQTMELGVQRDDHEQRFGSHGIRPVGADAWGPAQGGGTPAPDPYAIGPDQHARADERPRTDKGLPKRTPRNLALPEPDPRERTGSLNAEELRRRLGGFQRGARDGRRDVEAEIAADDRQAEQAGHTGQEGQTGAQGEGGTVEEARR
ncbi:nitrate- and nitrite sensing domain-containing protein [Streptomyces sp. NPDC005355]|uniref:sensor histidine kinase n=1 Tax=Streptomyces sp. NPDC005355 TaxID=3157038 RepID=UPI0033A11BE4